MTDRKPLRADAEANRRAIMSAGTRVLAESPEATLETVAQEAGVSRRTVYAHFRSRDELIAAIATAVGDDVHDRVAGIEDSEDPLVSLARLVHATSSQLAQHRRLGRVALREGGRADEKQRMTVVRRRLLSLVTEARRRHLVREDLPVDAQAHLVTGVQLAIFEAVVAGDLPERDASRAATTSTLAVLGVPAAEIARVEAQL